MCSIFLLRTSLSISLLFNFQVSLPLVATRFIIVLYILIFLYLLKSLDLEWLKRFSALTESLMLPLFVLDMSDDRSQIFKLFYNLQL